MLCPVKSINDNMLTDEALEALMQEEWLDAMGKLKNEYRNIPVPNEARDAVQKGIQRAKAEAEYRIAQPAAPKRSRKLWAALAAAVPVAATLLLFAAVNTNAQLAITAAENPTLKPMVEWMTGQEYHEDVHLDIKVAHLVGQQGASLQDAMLPLSALFAEDADYITAISTEIRRQMQQTTAYEAIGATFTGIAPEQTYYLNEDNKLVIVLDALDTAPEFVIPTEVIAELLK